MFEQSSKIPGRYDLLAQKYIEQRLDAAEAAELLEIVTSHPPAGVDLLEQLAIHASLREAANAEHLFPRNLEFHRGSRGWHLWLTAGLAASFMIAAAMYFHSSGSSRDVTLVDPVSVPRIELERTSNAVAVVGKSVGAVWKDDSNAPGAEEALPAGILRLESGFARIVFFSGARVTIAGPVEFEIVSQDYAICHSGRVSAEVPPQASGFTIGTPEGDVRDLGTSFGVAVGPEGAEVHVFNGEVEIEDGKPKKFYGGEGVKLVRGKATDRFPSNPKMFTPSRSTLSGHNETLKKKSIAWLAKARRIRLDSNLLAHYDFEQVDASEITVDNHAFQADAKNAVRIGGQLVEGRWAGGKAFQFRNLSDRIRFGIPGEFRSLTLQAWISVHALPNRFQSIITTDGFEQGEVHWQITREGSLRVSVHNAPDWPASYGSTVAFPPEKFGQWAHVAVVIDGSGRRIEQYLNGKRIFSEENIFIPRLSIGSATVGNWSDPFSVSPIRNFVGLIDDVMIHDRALSGDEISELYSVSRSEVLAIH